MGQFLARFDVLSSRIAEEALLSVFVTRPEVFEAVEFSGMCNFIGV
jgi:condensin complex subunit 3